MSYIMSLEGLKEAKDYHDMNLISSDYKQESSKELSIDSFDISSEIFKYNKPYYEGFITAVNYDKKKSRRMSFQQTKVDDNNLGVLKTQDDYTTSQANVNKEVQKPDEVQKICKNTQKISFITEVQRINELLIRVVTARINPENPEFLIENLIPKMVSTQKYNSFKKLVVQTAQVFQQRVSGLKKTSSPPNERLFASKEIEFSQNQGNTEIHNKQSLPKDFNQSLNDATNHRQNILVYQKIVQSGFSHLTIFLEEFDYICNEVYTFSKDQNTNDHVEQNKKSMFGFTQPSVIIDKRPVFEHSKQSIKSDEPTLMDYYYYQNVFFDQNISGMSLDIGQSWNSDAETNKNA